MPERYNDMLVGTVSPQAAHDVRSIRDDSFQAELMMEETSLKRLDGVTDHTTGLVIPSMIIRDKRTLESIEPGKLRCYSVVSPFMTFPIVWNHPQAMIMYSRDPKR
jgi:hypothetical protein